MARALAAPGEGADHAVLVLCHRLRWIHWLDPKWAEKYLIPLFDLTHPKAEPAWSGFAVDNVLPGPEIFRYIKRPFLAIFSQQVGWAWEESVLRRLSQFLVVGVLSNAKGLSAISFSEARSALQSATDKTRLDALWQLDLLVQDNAGWKKAGKPFLERAWPKEAKYQTGATSKQLAHIAISAADDFPDAAKVILPLLRPAEQLEMFIYYATGAENEKEAPLARRFPKQTIEVVGRLVPLDPKMLPYDLGALLSMTADAQPSLRQDLQWRRLNDLLIGR
jgi:hypothetical protein